MDCPYWSATSLRFSRGKNKRKKSVDICVKKGFSCTNENQSLQKLGVLYETASRNEQNKHASLIWSSFWYFTSRDESKMASVDFDQFRDENQSHCAWSSDDPKNTTTRNKNMFHHPGLLTHLSESWYRKVSRLYSMAGSVEWIVVSLSHM